MKTCRALAILVFMIAASVLVGWRLDMDALMRVIPGAVTMKKPTACLYLMASSVTFLATLKPSIIRMTCLAVLGGQMALVVAMEVGKLWEAKNIVAEVQTVRVGMPSLGTLVVFSLIALYAILSVMIRDPKCRITRRVGTAPAVIGGVALVGYAANVPNLYYYVPDWSTAMAVHTAALSVMLGVAIDRLHAGLIKEASHGMAV